VHTTNSETLNLMYVRSEILSTLGVVGSFLVYLYLGAARKALEIRPDYAEAHNNVAAGLASLGRWDEAIAAAREALRLRPGFPLARSNLEWAEREKAKGYRGASPACRSRARPATTRRAVAIWVKVGPVGSAARPPRHAEVNARDVIGIAQLKKQQSRRTSLSKHNPQLAPPGDLPDAMSTCST
jgi:Flp pilus assembly protein TadD